ncbi:hypothetical protein TIFTF001_015476 [Ficus carica]|uniref:Exonuclease 1 n=1 Tax=Ficus carica TaxID=3494 RepID=A0AA88DIN1_FICCA|nr:hypothetical protein TIFTF001_015476 [Ficus carica]
MGIKDLLRFMKPYIKPIHIKKYAGMRVGIDAYSWLHKGAYSCSMELCLDSDSEKKLRYIDYFMHRINLLRHYKITPVVVFDGGNIPCKAETEQDRHRHVSHPYLFLSSLRKTTNRDLAMEKLKEGNVSAASEFFQRAVSITPSMAHQLIQILRSENIEFVVAPYEADAQLAYLSSLKVEKGGITAVITEDSDLIAYGCKAIAFKMDRYGNGEEILLDDVFDSVSGTPSFRNFDKELFTGMCVLAGCDFLPSVPGIGIAKSHALVSKYRNLDRVLSVLKLEKRKQMPEDYPKSFIKALAVFRHALIYDADTKKLKHMRPLPETLLQSLDRELDFLGPEIPPSVAIAIAEGNVDPISMEAFDHAPSARCRQDPIRIQTSGRPPRVEAPVVSARESCFVAFSNQKARETDSTGKLFNKLQTNSCRTLNFKIFRSAVQLIAVANKGLKCQSYQNCNKISNLRFHLPKLKVRGSKFPTVHECCQIWRFTAFTCFLPLQLIHDGLLLLTEKMNPILNEEKYINKVEALQKLIMPSTVHEVIETTTLMDIPLNVPDNNPFKRWKFDQNHSDQIGSQVSGSTHVEDLDNSVISNGTNISQKVLENGASRKRKLEDLTVHKVEKVSEPISVVTKEENSEVLCMVSESQESVNSKANKIAGGGKRKGKIGKLKSSISKSSDTKKSTILNFFSRV